MSQPTQKLAHFFGFVKRMGGFWGNRLFSMPVHTQCGKYSSRQNYRKSSDPLPACWCPAHSPRCSVDNGNRYGHCPWTGCAGWCGSCHSRLSLLCSFRWTDTASLHTCRQTPLHLHTVLRRSRPFPSALPVPDILPQTSLLPCCFLLSLSLTFILYFIMNVSTQDVKYSSYSHSLVQLFFRAFLHWLSFGKWFYEK